MSRPVKTFPIVWLGLPMILAFLAASGVLGAACSNSDKECTQTCLASMDCNADQKCVEGCCQALGKSGEPCPKLGCAPGLYCHAGTCEEKCRVDSDCGSNEVCDSATGKCETVSRDSGPAGDQPPDTGGTKAKEGEECGAGLPACDQNLECVKKDKSLAKGKCWKLCTKDSDCGGNLCALTGANGHCVPNDDKCEFASASSTTPRIPCWPGLVCIRDGMVEGLCLKTCTTKDDCPKDLACDKKDSKTYCLPPKDLAGPGQACGDVGGKQVGCVKGYGCIPERVGATKSICAKKCTQHTECQWPKYCGGSHCTKGSVGTAQIGQKCKGTPTTPAEQCDGGLVCVTTKQDADGTCYRECKDARAPKCPTGSKCVQAGGTMICQGVAGEGQPCDQSTPCDTGHICVGTQGGTGNVCRKSCDPASPSCPAPLKCVKLQSGSGGACVPG